MCIFPLLLVAATVAAIRLVPVDEFMGIQPKKYEWPTQSQCEAPAEGSLESLGCRLIQAEHQMHLIAGLLAREKKDPGVLSQQDIDRECDSFHRWSAIGSRTTVAILENSARVLGALDKDADVDIVIAEIERTSAIHRTLLNVTIPNVSEWCGPIGPSQ